MSEKLTMQKSYLCMRFMELSGKMDSEKVYNMSFQKIYTALVNKALRKGRTKEEVDEIIMWLTGYTEADIGEFGRHDISYGEFFQMAPQLNPDRKLITGSICGIKVETIQDSLMQEIRYLDKLVDELAKGKAMDKIKRSSSVEQKMWKCPGCKREFRKENQSHFCGEKPKTIDEYILGQDEIFQADLFHMRTVLSSALPEAEERISWSMPTFWNKHNILHFAASKKHIGFYPGPAAVEHFADQLSEYKTDKGTIRIPYGKIDDKLVGEIAKWCWDTDNHA